jgi:hypothetical protein
MTPVNGANGSIHQELLDPLMDRWQCEGETPIRF